MAGVSSVKLFVGNLPFSATNNTLETFFSPFGELIGVKLVEDRSTHRPRGFGFVTFKESAAADRALMANGRELEGRDLTIRRAVARGTGSLKGEGGSDDKSGSGVGAAVPDAPMPSNGRLHNGQQGKTCFLAGSQIRTSSDMTLPAPLA